MYPFLQSILPANLNLKQLMTYHWRCQFRQRLSSWTRNTKQQSMTARLFDDSTNSNQVLYCIIKHYNLHRAIWVFIIFRQSIISTFFHSLFIHHLLIWSLSCCSWCAQMAKHKASNLILCINNSIFVLIQMLKERIEFNSKNWSCTLFQKVHHFGTIL